MTKYEVLLRKSVHENVHDDALGIQNLVHTKFDVYRLSGMAKKCRVFCVYKILRISQNIEFVLADALIFSVFLNFEYQSIFTDFAPKLKSAKN